MKIQQSYVKIALNIVNPAQFPLAISVKLRIEIPLQTANVLMAFIKICYQINVNNVVLSANIVILKVRVPSV